MPGPPLTHTQPFLRKGAGPSAHSARGISGRGGPGGAVSRSPGTIGPGGHPPGLHSNSPCLPTFARAEPGAQRGRGQQAGNPRMGGNAGLASPVSPTFPRPFRPKLFCTPFFRCIPPFACRSWLWWSLQFANWGGGGVAKRGRPLPCKPEGSLRCMRRRAGQARPGWAPTP